jgi:alkylation response protein AidB-like acyl-CoA dehydrogenase
MDLNFTADENAFREEVRAFVHAKLPESIRHKVMNGLRLSRDDHVAWQRTLHAKGWGGPTWPKEFGGTGWTPVQQYIFEEESTGAGGPRLIPFGLKMVAPVIMTFGNQSQQQRFLPRILAADDWWCQGYSEPGAGSDLASLKTRAELNGDRFIVNGQKTWTTYAQYADWIFCLVRTDATVKQQQGISFMLIDMKSPGVTVRPITMVDGTQEVNEVWFENVNVPAENLIGEINKGWTYAKFLLGHERANIAGVGIAKRELGRVKKLAAGVQRRGRALLDDPLLAAKIADVEIELMALEITNLRVLSAEAEHRAPGPEASILKIKGTEIQQAITELLIQAAGPAARAFVDEVMEADQQPGNGAPSYALGVAGNYFNMRKLSIYGGSNEIQKNIIAQMILQL